MRCTAPGNFVQTQVFENIEQSNGCTGTLEKNPELTTKDEEGNDVLTPPVTNLAYSATENAETHFTVDKFFNNKQPTRCPMTSCELYENTCRTAYKWKNFTVSPVVSKGVTLVDRIEDDKYVSGYWVTADINKPEGWSNTVCVVCRNLGGYVKLDNVEITADPKFDWTGPIIAIVACVLLLILCIVCCIMDKRNPPVTDNVELQNKANA